MHSQTKSKKSKSVKQISPIKIKKEAEELHSLSHYVDDRVELVKQIFAVLKSKTIKSLAPDFLKKSSIEEIEELCLNELLGISTKRLNAIIESTKCPTDTETSSDSDVNNIEEHISLEEISSDSETEGKSKTKTKGKVNRKKVTAAKPGDESNAKEISVLELLELQARARAIRSQLALEPITKIEVDSGESSDSEGAFVSQKTPNKKLKIQNKDAKTNGQLVKLVESVNGNLDKATTSSNNPPTKRIKLIRNFRKQQKNDSDSEKDDCNKKSDTETSKNNTQEKEKLSPKREERSTSPDVITILPSPETLYISDSSDEGKQSTNHKKNENKKSSNEEILNKSLKEIQNEEKSSQKNPTTENLENVEIMTTTTTAFTDKISIENNKKNEEESQPTKQPPVEDEIEDGEILDQDDESESEEVTEEQTNPQQQTSNESNKILSSDDENKNNQNICDEKQNEIDETEKTECNNDDLEKDNEKKIACKTLNSSDCIILDCENEHQNDDVISLGHDDYDYEMRDQLDEDASQKDDDTEMKEQQNTKSLNDDKTDSMKTDSNEPIDFIDLHDDDESDDDDDDDHDDDNSRIDSITDQQKHNKTDDDDNNDKKSKQKQSQSWNSRWLKSSKVSKILATSRLGNRVRDKIKNAKKFEQNSASQSESELNSAQNSPKIVFESKFEDGSVNQYKEILDMKDSN